ncbi:MAG TPA: VanW family protein, partial [Coriobacteriia bacterium]|nr:VanW family protein [Coriobacteriia bacterium]
GEVRVGAMQPERAASAVVETYGPRLAEPVMVRFEDREWKTEQDALSVTLNAEALVAEAMRYGRTGSFGERVMTRARLLFDPVSVPVRADADASALSAYVEEIAEEVRREPRDASVLISGTEVTLEPSAVGIEVRGPDFTDAVLQAFVATDRRVDVPVDFIPVRVTDADAADALEDARAFVAGPVTVVGESGSWEFTAAEVGAWVDFRTEEVSSAHATGSAEASPGYAANPSQSATAAPAAVERWRLVAFISAEEASKTVLARVGEAGTPAVDARFEVGGGGVRIVPSRDGVGIDVEALTTEMTRVLTTEPVRRVELRTQRIEPALTTERAERMGVKERIATFTTRFSASNRPRVSNIHTLSDAIDGTLVAPGETFSLNGTVGPRTAAKGYQEAPAIIDGRLVPTLGGGICQVATTLFNTVFESGLPVIERRNHSFYISAYPKGRDAAVSWGGIDFRFKNDTENWVLVATAYTDSSVTVSLYGTDPGYTVTSTTGPFTDIRPFTVLEVPDATLSAGTRVVEDEGVNGRRVTVTRTVMRGAEVVREDRFTSTYVPKRQVVRVGTKPPASVAPTATPAPGS